MKTNLVLTFTSPDRPGIVEALTKTVVKHGGNWEESRLARLCGDFAGIARVSLEDDQVDALRVALDELREDSLIVHVKPTREPSPIADSTTAELVCSGADHEGIVSGLAEKLSELDINVIEMETGVVPAPTTGTPLFTMNCQIQIPLGCNTESLRADLEQLENELAVEIVLRTG